MAEKLRPITIDMFSPYTSERSRRTTVGLARLMDDFYGKGKQLFYRSLRNVINLDNETAQEVDKNVFESVKNYYSLLDRHSPPQFYLEQQKQPIGLIKDFGAMLPELRQELELKNEVSMFSDRPSALFWFLSRPSSEIDRVLEYEVHRQALLMICSGRINAVHLRERSLSVLSSVFNHLSRTLFEGKIGEGEQIFLESAHDDDTNEVVGFPDHDQEIPPTAHRKRVHFNTRSVKGFGRVYTSPRKKGDSNVLGKAIADASAGDRVIKVDAAEDRLGIMYVTIEKDADPRKLADLVITRIESGPRQVAEVVEDDLVNQQRGQSQEFKFDARRIVRFKRSAVPLEMVFLSLENYLNSEYEVGKRDSQTGLYMGRAHELYELRRGLRIAPVLFPQEIYPVDFKSAFRKMSIMKAEELKRRNRVD